MSEDTPQAQDIRVFFATASPQWQIRLELAVRPQATVSEVLVMARAALLLRDDSAARAAWVEAPWDNGVCGLHGERCGRDQIVTRDDRVELYLPLQMDPKLERRRRAERSQTTKARNPLTVRSKL